MKKIYLISIVATLAIGSHAQEIRIATKGKVHLFTKTGMFFSGLTIMPAMRTSLSEQRIIKDTSVSNTFTNPHILRTYLFTGTPVFTGSVRMNYHDTELDGIPESALQLGVYNGTAWQAAGSSTVNTTDKYVLTTGINSQPIGEAMWTTSVLLPLLWLDLSAVRTATSVRVAWRTGQERNVDHFDVERSTDAYNWITAVKGVPASNKNGGSAYEAVDNPGFTGPLYYRVKQTDISGSYSYSKIVSVAGANQAAGLILSPNPATTYFIIDGAKPAEIKKVDLLNASGGILSSWNSGQLRFNLTTISAGIYYVRIQMVNGAVVSKSLVIK